MVNLILTRAKKHYLSGLRRVEFKRCHWNNTLNKWRMYVWATDAPACKYAWVNFYIVYRCEIQLKMFCDHKHCVLVSLHLVEANWPTCWLCEEPYMVIVLLKINEKFRWQKNLNFFSSSHNNEAKDIRHMT